MAFTISNLGQENASGDVRALFLKKFAGEVLTAFLRKTVMQNRHLVRQLSGGAKSAQFPATWRASADYHVPGNEVTGGEIKHGERVIHVDYPLTSQHYLAQWEELVNHYDVRSIYATMQGEAIANTFDTHALIVLALTARASDLFGGDGFSGEDSGDVVNANAGTNGETLASIAFAVAQAFDEKDVPDTDRFLFLKPAQYYLLSQTTKVLNKDWSGSGSYAEGTVDRVAGLQLVKTNNVPQTNIASSPTGTFNTYHGDFSNTVALAGHRSAVGSVRMMDIASDSEWVIEKQATLLISKMITGTGILRPEAAAEIKSA